MEARALNRDEQVIACACCDVLTLGVFLELVDGVGWCCPACWEVLDAESHEDGCRCHACAQLRRDIERELRALEAHTNGGLRCDALSLLGEDIRGQ